MRTSSGLGPAFTATDGHQGLGVRVLFSPGLFGLPQSCARLPSLADGATGTHSCRVPDSGTPLLRVPGGSEGGPLDSRVLPFPGGGAVRVCSQLAPLRPPREAASPDPLRNGADLQEQHANDLKRTGRSPRRLESARRSGSFSEVGARHATAPHSAARFFSSRPCRDRLRPDRSGRVDAEREKQCRPLFGLAVLSVADAAFVRAQATGATPGIAITSAGASA